MRFAVGTGAIAVENLYSVGVMQSGRERLSRLIAGRRTKFVAIGAWLLIALALGPLAGKFEGAQRNEPSSFLPAGAEWSRSFTPRRASRRAT